MAAKLELSGLKSSPYSGSPVNQLLLVGSTPTGWMQSPYVSFLVPWCASAPPSNWALATNPESEYTKPSLAKPFGIGPLGEKPTPPDHLPIGPPDIAQYRSMADGLLSGGPSPPEVSDGARRSTGWVALNFVSGNES